MAFSDFKNVAQVIKKYPLKVKSARFLPDLEVPLPEWFIENINFSLDMQSVNESEAFLRESFIFPFMHEAWKRHPKLKLWSHQRIEWDKDLFGEPDYFVSRLADEVTDTLITTPLLAVSEAKRDDFATGWGQCLAEMIACQKINGEKEYIVYGIVTTGIYWEFGKLEGQSFTKHPISYSISEPNKIFGSLSFIFAECEKQII